jgi:hypothetical protein
VYCTSTSVQNAHATSRLHVYDGRPQHPRGHSEAQEDGSAAPRGLEPRHRLVGPRPHGALTVCGPLGVLWCVSNSSYTSRPIQAVALLTTPRREYRIPPLAIQNGNASPARCQSVHTWPRLVGRVLVWSPAAHDRCLQARSSHATSSALSTGRVTHRGTTELT